MTTAAASTRSSSRGSSRANRSSRSGTSAELRAEYERVKSLSVIPDRWEEAPNGQTYAWVWAKLSTRERGEWLKGKGFTVTASKDAVTVSLHFANGAWAHVTRKLRQLAGSAPSAKADGAFLMEGLCRSSERNDQFPDSSLGSPASRAGVGPLRAFVDGYHAGLLVTIALLAAGVVISYLTLRPR